MKRSELHQIMRDAVEFIKEMKFQLPPFAFWSPEEWVTKGADYDEIRDNMLGWDITDFGQGDYKKIGLLKVRKEEFPKNTLRKIKRFELDQSIT